MSRDSGKFSWRVGAIAFVFLLLTAPANAEQPKTEGVYRNPLLYSDYSDPDVIRAGSNYYLIASSFHFVPGLPILQSPDLIHWTIVGHALPRIPFGPAYDMAGGNRYGRGVWAPSIRQHDGLFYIYFPTPDEGIFVTTAAKITGPWSTPVAVISGPGLEDPCPFWDEDGKAYLVHSVYGAGPLILHRMAPDGKSVLDQGKVIVRDPESLPTLEGPKFYKRNGYYYIFAPFGGVGTGSQVVLRSRSIDGPYEHRVVLAQGTTDVNGPHQGGYVETPDGQAWFIHFHSSGAHGRIVYLEPMRWENDWPVIGEAAPGAEAGQPVASWPFPHYAGAPSHQHPQTSDEFSASQLSPQWEWNHNPDNAHWSLTARPGFLRLMPMKAGDLLSARNTLTQQMQDKSLEFTARLDLQGMRDGMHAGIAILEKSASGLQVVEADGKRTLTLFTKSNVVEGPAVTGQTIELRLRVDRDTVSYSYSIDEGKSFQAFGETIPITFSWWKGSRPSLFTYSTGDPDGGYADFDWVHYLSRDQSAHQ
ncbi:beta-xylosidase [Silvibacterium bohemicum]|uniref:Beta-xylosidase n=1 Tax=Silvibacterium bohemicum TaxID=1577686 RepID=A0A841JX99_9BACT|nr:glycoside hydrolase 43 family protein [Silvibacterium bohemicum]MBB6143611.1 beta-xylosidase [Silvibacterium bohemicum]